VVFEDAEGLLRVVHAQDEEALLRGGERGEVGVFDVDLVLGERLRDAREHAGAVLVLDHEHLVLDDERAVRLEDVERLARVAHDHAHDGVVGRVGNAEAVDVDLRIGERVADGGKSAGLVVEKQRELLDDFHGRLAPV
jgi:hypothetical protein